MTKLALVSLIFAGVSTLACESGQLGGDGGVSGVGGAAGAAATGGTGGGSGRLECYTGNQSGEIVPIGIANREDFTPDTATGVLHDHTLLVLRRDYFDRVTMYRTAGPADHQHDVVVPEEQLINFARFEPVNVVTQSAVAGNLTVPHIHTVLIQPCGLPGD